jgi:hypothetical protein
MIQDPEKEPERWDKPIIPSKQNRSAKNEPIATRLN